MVSLSRRRRLKWADWPGRTGKRCPRRFLAVAGNLRYEGMPMFAWATQGVTTSASVSLRGTFFTRV